MGDPIHALYLLDDLHNQTYYGLFVMIFYVVLIHVLLYSSRKCPHVLFIVGLKKTEGIMEMDGI